MTGVQTCALPISRTFEIVHNVSRLSSDQSTENIAILAKTDYGSLTPEERMEMLLKKREVTEMKNVD